jgi:DNA invertase Pin-like site-specific DNA recombinase
MNMTKNLIKKAPKQRKIEWLPAPTPEQIEHVKQLYAGTLRVGSTSTNLSGRGPNRKG